MSQLQVNRINDASGGVLAPISSVMRNRIINGAMVIDQRNAGASVSVTANDTAIYIADRWYLAKNSSATISSQQSTVAPTGFSNSLLVNVSSGSAVGSTNYLICAQAIEGFNFADMGWGTANAKTITISFWVRSSLTGTFAVTLANASNNRCFGANYTISSANTWEYKTVTIAGDTSGTWAGATNDAGVRVYFSLGAGSTYQGSAGSWQAISNLLNTSTAQNTFLTTANTFYVTGVQLEVGTQATSFEYRQYQQELALCQRYYELAGSGIVGIPNSGTQIFAVINYKVDKRATPSLGISTTTPLCRQFSLGDRTGSGSAVSTAYADASSGTFMITGFSGVTTGSPGSFNTTGLFQLSAEL